MKEEFYTGLDLGSHSIKIAVAQANEEGALQVIGTAEKPAEGITKGSISSLDDAVTSLSGALEAAERMSGRPIGRASVGLSNINIMSQESRGVVAVSRADGEIKTNDVERVIDAAQAVATPPNHEILHVIPISFNVDNQQGVKDPTGMSGVRLEVVTQLVQVLSAEVKNITKAVYRCGLEINDLVLNSLASAEAILSRRQRELGVALVNLGASTTSVAVFEEGDMRYAGVIPIGSGHITSDLAIGLRTSIAIAERVKLAVGRVAADKVSKRDEIDLTEFSRQESGKIAMTDILKIIEARLEEIFDHVNERLSQINRAGRLPAGIVLTGGGAKLPGLTAAAKDHFKLPASLGGISNVRTSVDKAKGLEFATAIGLALWDRGFGQERGRNFEVPGLTKIGSTLSSVMSRVKGIFR